MLQTPVPFPFTGSKGFIAGTCDPCTVIRRNDDGSCLVRVDARPHHAANRDASGNRTLEPGQLCETEKQALEAGQTKPKRKARAGK